MAELIFGRIPHPPFRDRVIPDSENGAWDNLGPRKPVGVDQHSMVGSLWGTDGWFRRGAASNGLTDYGIGGSTDGPANDGLILRWNRPDGKATSVDYDGHKGKVSANRAGWANGGSDGLEGDGPLFVRTLGVAAINRDLVSIERSDGGVITTPMSAKQFENICALTAYWFDVIKVPWNRFPLNPAHGVVTHLLHKETATKDCPFPAVYNRINEIQDRVRAILKAGQTQTPGEVPIPPPNPPQPDHDDWAPFKLADLKKRYGTFPVTQIDGQEQTSRWRDQGSIPNAWVARAKAEGITKVADIPRPIASHVAADADGIEQMIVLFEANATQPWILHRPAREVAFRWLR